jgi:hypothetical protein
VGKSAGKKQAAQQRADEEARQAKIQEAVNTVNNTFNGAGRSKLYDGIRDAVFQTNVRDLDKQFTKASNNNLFGLIRSGLMGGSVDAESRGDLAERYGEGRIKALAAGNEAASGLQTNDERTRQNLIGMAQSGLDTGAAAQMANSQLAASESAARANQGVSTLGSLFDNLTQAYVQQQRRQPAPAQSVGSYLGSNNFGQQRYGNYMK